MSWSGAFVIFSGLLGVAGTILFCVGIVEVRRKDLVWLGTRAYGAGEQVALGMKSQQVDFIFGLILIALAFIVQVAGAFGAGDGIQNALSIACGLAVILSIFLLFIALYLGLWYLVRKRTVDGFKAELEKASKPRPQ
ncbi:MAG TPA: hypothetical protein VFN01_11310 [Marinobacter sp.]|uniref:hypothetical protein n=1 Tax=Marinobacter sp. TaxID=50741 RepID=UPI002D7EA687|nr:hypothetical protein [Marinobacter sp.]HET8801759.1 hypothetical protein [Marinobacter sp.]